MRIMYKKKIFFLICIFFFLVKYSSAQYNEVGLFFGAANYKGELSPHLFNKDFIHFAMGGFYRHNWNRHWSYNFELNYGRISGDDALAETGFERNRNLSFYSDIIEFSPLIEFNFFPYETGNSEFPFTPYLFTGISVLRFNPKTTYNGNDVELQPLGTEGQGLNGTSLYNRVVLAIPIGGGLKIDLGKFGLGIEVGTRRTYTDYLDDVSTVYPDQLKLTAARGPLAAALSDRSLNKSDTSTPLPTVTGKQRGNSKDNDWYVFAGITMYVRINSPGRDSCSPFKKRNY
jgi:hypothetical protein